MKLLCFRMSATAQEKPFSCICQSRRFLSDGCFHSSMLCWNHMIYYQGNSSGLDPEQFLYLVWISSTFHMSIPSFQPQRRWTEKLRRCKHNNKFRPSQLMMITDSAEQEKSPASVSNQLSDVLLWAVDQCG